MKRVFCDQKVKFSLFFRLVLAVNILTIYQYVISGFRTVNPQVAP
jgi:hypothetical protein